MRRSLPWLSLLSVACAEFAMPDFPTEGRSCPAPYAIDDVAFGEPVLLDWSPLAESGGDEVDQLILGRLPMSREQLLRRWCRGEEVTYDWTETLEVAPGTLTFELTPEQVGELGTTTVVGLRAVDKEVATMGLTAAEGEETEILFEEW